VIVFAKVSFNPAVAAIKKQCFFELFANGTRKILNPPSTGIARDKRTKMILYYIEVVPVYPFIVNAGAGGRQHIEKVEEGAAIIRIPGRLELGYSFEMSP
jgi:hypothetical protein